MKILRKYVLNDIKMNKKRNIGSVVSIALSTLLICSTLIVAMSFYTTIKNDTIAVKGNQHSTFNFLDKNNATKLLSNSLVDSYFITQQVGYINLDNSKGKPYLCLQEYDDMAINQNGIRLLEGRFPENSDEVVISKQIEDNAKIKYNIGDIVNFDVYKITLDNTYEFNQSSTYLRKLEETERITKIFLENRSFKIVGIIEKPDDHIEPLKSAGYTIITKLDFVRDRANYSVRYKDIYNANEIAKKIEEELQITSLTNVQLLQLEGAKSDISIVKLAIFIVIIMILIIAISSILIIRSSFYISISNKIKQYSILSSIGAKKRQIKKLAYKENFIISTIGIFIGIILSICVTYILILLVRNLIEKNSFLTAVEVAYEVPIWTIILGIIISYITMYFASISSINKLNSISPILSMKRIDYDKIETKNIKQNSILKKVFGIGGVIAYKNIKRNSKRYNSLMITIVISLVMLISVVSFVKYTEKMNKDLNEEKQYNVLIGYKVKEDLNVKYNTFLDIVKDTRINKYSILRNVAVWTDLEKYVNSNNKENYNSNVVTLNSNKIVIPINSIGKEEYLRFIEKLGLSYEECKSQVIWCNNTALTGIIKGDKKIQLLNMDIGDEITFNDQNNKEDITLKIASITDIYPMGLERMNSQYGYFIVSDEFFDNHFNPYTLSYLTVNTDIPFEFCNDINKNYDEILARDILSEEERENNKTLIMYAIGYGIIFIILIISITNIYNNISSSIILRKREFAILKSIGMTKKEFNNMLNLESLFYCIESIIISLILSLGINLGIRYFICRFDIVPIIIPYKVIIISALLVFIFVNMVERIIAKKIQKENIIDDIRNENI